jgi:aspartate dehydrogenase
LAAVPLAVPVALIGCGNLGSHIARGIATGAAGAYRLTAVFNGARHAKARRLAQETGACACETLEALLATRPEYVVEAASGSVLGDIAVPCLRAGASLIVLSTGAFADTRLLAAAADTAREHRSKIYFASGALGGFDVAQAAMIGGDLNVSMTTEKPPRAFGELPAVADGPDDDAVREVYRGSAREAIARFPKNVNVVVALGLATTGLDRTKIAIRSNPRLTSNRHVVMLDGAFGTARVEIEARPSPDHPQSSLLAAYSVLALLRKIASPIQI